MKQRSDSDNQDFGAGTPGVREAYRELPQDEPPAHLDREIRAHAEAAVARPAPRQRWVAPVALAATVLLSFALVMRIVQPPQQPGMADSMPSLEAPAPTLAPDEDLAAASQPAVSPERKLAETAQPPARPMDSVGRLEQSAAPAKASAADDARQRVATSNVARQPQATPAAAMAPAIAPEEQLDQSPEGQRADVQALEFGSAAGSEPGCVISVREDRSRWLECMRNLKDRGLAQALSVELEAWRTNRPDEPLPEDLQAPQ